MAFYDMMNKHELFQDENKHDNLFVINRLPLSPTKKELFCKEMVRMMDNGERVKLTNGSTTETGCALTGDKDEVEVHDEPVHDMKLVTLVKKKKSE